MSSHCLGELSLRAVLSAYATCMTLTVNPLADEIAALAGFDNAVAGYI